MLAQAMPNTREMLSMVARDPVAQARFFILSMRLFCEHVLGTGPFDHLLRHNGHLNDRAEGPAFSDGFAATEAAKDGEGILEREVKVPRDRSCKLECLAQLLHGIE